MNILAFFAHPDDETMLTGGVLALLAKLGHPVNFLCATRGEGGERGIPPLCEPDELGHLREQELACAARALSGASLTFMEYIDPKVGPDNQLYAYAYDVDRLVSQVSGYIRQFQAQVVITHGSNGEYGHPAHRQTHQAARRAVETYPGEFPLLYSVMATFPDHPRKRLANPDDPAHLIIDVSSVLNEKTQAAMCHRTQHALFVRNPSKEAGRSLTVPEVIQSRESLHRVYPPSAGDPNDALAQALKPWLLKP
jgi:N-acetylglucosamine malate deacetylase 2